MARTLNGRPLVRPTTRNQNTDEQARQRRSHQRVPPKRSVSSLSATQLERKRANDREAQRLIRQRTKDRIDGLEKQIADLQRENDRLNKCLKQRSIREMENAQRNKLESRSTSVVYAKDTKSPRGQEPLSMGDTRGFYISGSAPGASAAGYSPVAPRSFATNPVPRPSHASQTLEMDMNPSAYYWGASTTCSSTDESIEERPVPYQRALPTPMYSSLCSPYQQQSISPLTRYCVLPNGQPHLPLSVRQSDDAMNRRSCNQAGWPL